MNNVLIRQSVKRDGSWSFHDLDIQADEVTLGSASDNVIVLPGIEIAPQHLTIFTINQQLWLKCQDKHRVALNGLIVTKTKINVGDKIKVGDHIVSVVPSPPGFHIALQVDSSNIRGDRKQFVHKAREALPSAKKPAWMLGLLTLLVLLIAPFLVSQYERSVDSEGNTSGIDAIWSPGDLHPAHQLSTGGDCSSCHEKLFTRTTDSACLSCHTGQIGHIPVEHVTDIGIEENRCGTCHQEHNGRSSLLNHANSNCQSCHEIDSFTSQHPEFEHYPTPEYTGILFDHSVHNSDYFLDTEKPFDCSGCHRLDQAGQHQITTSFEEMCINCHGEKASSVASKVYHHGKQILSADPVVFFVLPRLDLKRLAENVDIGAWPIGTKKGTRSGLTKLGLTPFMELLLSSDPTAGPALGRLKENKIKLSSLKKASESDIADAVTIVWAIKHLLADLAVDPVKALTHRLSSVIEQPLGKTESASLSAQMQGTFVSSLTNQWFGAGAGFSLAEDIQASPLTEAVNKLSRQNKLSSNEANVLGSSWINTTPWQAHKFSMQYHPGGHADNFVKAWLDLSLHIANHTEEDRDEKQDSGFGSKEAAEELLIELADLEKSKPGKSKGAGACSKCHSVFENASGENQFAWLSKKPNPLDPSSTQFSHIKHSANSSKECLHCHAWTEHKDFLITLQAAEVHISNFEALSKESCSECHTEGGRVESQCLDCHSYHVTTQSSE